ncbi:hypothetical protein RI367_001290 [Sorochytrium milnesiophthora]
MAFSFGQTNANQQQQQPAFSFGSTPSAFGAQSTPQQPQSTGFSFGAPAQQPSAFGQPASGFGQTPANTGSIFGAAAAQQTQPSAFGASGGFGASTTPAFGAPATGAGGVFGAGSSFGASNTQPSAFGAQQQQPAASGFGGFGASAAPAASGFGAFGQNNNASGAGTFGGSNAFGSSTLGGGSAFGSGATGFGAANSVSTVNSGTGNPKYAVTKETVGLTTEHFQAISAMPAYKNFSFEELRVQDYVMGKKQAGTGMGTGAMPGFGSQPAAATSTFGGGFGQQQPSATAFGQAPSAFGTNSNSGFGASTPGFGANAGSAFGASNNAASGTSAFGQPAAPSAFGGGVSAFGQPQQATNAFGQPASSGFGGAASSFGGTPSAFGQPQQSQPGSSSAFSFGSNNNATKPGFGASGAGFGGAAGFGASQPSTFGGFGAGTGAATSTAAAPSAFGGFGANASKPFGITAPATSTPALGFGGFGAVSSAKSVDQKALTCSRVPGQTSQPQQPATGLFGAAAPTAGSAFGQTPASSAPGGFAFGAQPAASAGQPFGSTAGSFSFNKPAATSTTSAFPSFGAGLGANPAGGSSFAGFGGAQSTAQTPFGGSLGGAFGAGGAFGMQNNLVAGNAQVASVASVDKLPYGYNSLFEAVPAPSYKSADDKTKTLAVPPVKPKMDAPPSHIYTTPRALTKLKLRGFAQTSISHGGLQRRSLDYFPGTSAAQLRAFKAPADEAVLPPQAYTPRASIRKLDIQQDDAPRDHLSPSGNGRHVKSLLSDTPSFAAKRQATPSYGRTFSPEAPAANVDLETPSRPTGSSAVRRLDFASSSAPGDNKSANEALTRKLPQTDHTNGAADAYSLSPSLEQLLRMSPEQLQHVENFSVSVPGVGTVRFLEPVDLSDVPLDSIAGNIVCIEHSVACLYPKARERPPHGQGLNVPVRIELYGCWVKDRATGQPIKDPSDPRMENHINKLRSRRKTSFVDYDIKTGKWVFEVREL